MRDWPGESAWALLDLVVPQECVGCRRPGRAWCPTCAASVVGASLSVPGPVPCRAAAPHAGPVAGAVAAFKDAGARSLAGPLADLLAGAVRDVVADVGWATRARGPAGPVWLVPAPTRPQARRARGADHMAVLAGRAARALRGAGLPAHRCSALVQVRASRDQVGLARAQRMANVAGTMAARPVPDGLLVVVDDVLTTGATMSEATRALGAATGRPAVAATITWAGMPASRLRGRGTSV